jgi:hypothetical protein
MFVSAAFAWLLAGLREALTQPEHGVKCFFLCLLKSGLKLQSCSFTPEIWADNFFPVALKKR